MARLGPKYLAGFLDADGYIGVVFVAGLRKPQLRLHISQKTQRDKVLHLLHEEFGGCLSYQTVKGVSYTKLSWSGNRQCAKLLSLVRKHLVVKRHYAEVCLDLCSRDVQQDEIPAIREYLKIQRRQRSLPIPPHPSRRWLAGYLDGDGCFSVRGIHKNSGVASIVLHVAASVYDTEGIELIQKQFGGRIHNMCEGRVRQLVVSLNPTKTVALLKPIAKHMVVKRAQAEFLLRCAERMGHFRDGRSIKSALKYLKACPHRLNEPEPDVEALIATVKDLPKYKRPYESYLPKAKRQSDQAAV